ncbi:hypothetical protein FBY40_0178 [Microbacterium sp. SLBN-154]|nr:hypothetical protein FBY40_0178 [Microbacterium sp. SLBN-154]
MALPHIEGDDVASLVGTLEGGSLFEMVTGWSHAESVVAIFGTRGWMKYEDNAQLTVKGTEPLRGRSFTYGGSDEVAVFSGKRIAQPDMGDTSNPLEQHHDALVALSTGKRFAYEGTDAVEDLGWLDLVNSFPA